MNACYVKPNIEQKTLADLEPGDTFIFSGHLEKGLDSPEVHIVTNFQPSDSIMCVGIISGQRSDARCDCPVIKVEPEGQVKFKQVWG